MDDRLLRTQLVALLRSENAHVDFDAAVDGLPAELRDVAPAGHPHTAWQLVEHLRLAQRDILDFCRDPDYEAAEFPDGYWPASATPPDDAAWDDAIDAFRTDLDSIVELAEDPTTDLSRRIEWWESRPTLLREILIVADHNAYHVGQLVQLRRALDAWPS